MGLFSVRFGLAALSLFLGSLSHAQEASSSEVETPISYRCTVTFKEGVSEEEMVVNVPLASSLKREANDGVQPDLVTAPMKKFPYFVRIQMETQHRPSRKYYVTNVQVAPTEKALENGVDNILIQGGAASYSQSDFYFVGGMGRKGNDPIQVWMNCQKNTK